MKAILFLALTIAFFSSSGCQGPRNNEWVYLFDGRDLNNWVVKCKPRDKDKTYWYVEDSAIVADSLSDPDHDYIWLTTKKEYTNFVLELDFMAFKNSPGNSGIQISSRYDEINYWLDGPQIDIHPSGFWRTGFMWDETRGNQRWIFPDIPMGKWVDNSMAINQSPFYFAEDNKWNHMRIEVVDLKVKAWLNDSLVTDFDGSKILNDAIHEKYDIVGKGHIALQIHTKDELKIMFKKIRIKEY